MNLKQAKRIRKHVRYYIRNFLDNKLVSERDREYSRLIVPSKRYEVTVTTANEDGTKTSKTEKDKAIQIRLVEGCGREVYKRVKRRVLQNSRRGKQPGVLSRIRSGIGAAVGGVMDNAGAT